MVLDIVAAKLRAIHNDEIDKSDEELMPPPPSPGGCGRGRDGVLWLSKKAGNNNEGNNEGN